MPTSLLLATLGALPYVPVFTPGELGYNCIRIPAILLAGNNPDEEPSLDILPPEWRWQEGGAQHGAGKGAERQHYFNRLSRLHTDQHPVLGYVRSTKKLCLPEEAARG